MPVIYSVRGISKRFGVVQALSGVDLDVVQGKVVGLVGANGAGKSTLLKIIAGALPPDSGALKLDGKPLVMTSIAHAARAGIAIVSQELSLFPTLSVEENLLLAPGGRDWKSRRAFARRAREIFAKLGANVALSAPLHRLALADRQLIEIARALLQNPRVLILDEPTSSLHARRGRSSARCHQKSVRFRNWGDLRQSLSRRAVGHLRQSRDSAQRQGSA